MYHNRLVYIIGFMGSGKSTTGRKIASALKWPFLDLDTKIEEKAEKTIAQIFSQHGESYFRKIEAEVLRNHGTFADAIISTGGGTPCFEDNMDYMLKTGLTVYLKMTPVQLASRLSNSSGERPLLQNITDDKLIDYIDEKLAFREKWYNKSKIIINGLNIDISLLTLRIKSSFSP